MEKKLLKGLDWEPLWVSHLGCIKGCLDYLNMEVSDAWLFGATGHAFIMNMHEVVCPSGPTAWDTERFYQLGRNLGYELKTVHGLKTEKNFAQKQKEAWELVKLAVNAGFPCYGWELAIPEYYVVYGYDQNRYYFKGPGASQSEPKPWMELGDSDIGALEMHAVKPGEAADDATTVKEALGFALEFAQSPNKWVMDKYKAGLAGFDLWIGALKADAAHELGMPYNAAVWHECRHLAVEFLKEAKERSDDKLGSIFDEAISHYEVIRDSLKKVTEQFPFEGRKPEHVKDPERIGRAIEALKKAKEAEARGLETLEKIAASL